MVYINEINAAKAVAESQTEEESFSVEAEVQVESLRLEDYKWLLASLANLTVHCGCNLCAANAIMR